MIPVLVVSLFAAAGYALYRAVHNAPEGWEDSDGFHQKPDAGAGGCISRDTPSAEQGVSGVAPVVGAGPSALPRG